MKIHDTHHRIMYDEHSNLRQFVNWRLQFIDKNLKSKYEQYRKSHCHYSVYVFFQLLMTVYTIISKWSAYRYFPSQLTAINFVFGLFCPVFLGTVLLAVSIWEKVLHVKIAPKGMCSTLVPTLQGLWVVGTCVSFNLGVIVVGYGGKCDSQHMGVMNSWGCTYSSEHQMPEDMMFFALILPMFLSLLVKGASWNLVCISYLMGIASDFFCIYYFDLTISLLSLLLIIPVTAIMMYEHQRQRVSMFLLSETQRGLLLENKVLADEAHATEMRHMIGNVAHDLKTVNSLIFHF